MAKPNRGAQSQTGHRLTTRNIVSTTQEFISSLTNHHEKEKRMLTIAGFVIGLVFYSVRFARPQMKRDLERGEVWGTGIRSSYVREMRRGLILIAVLAPFVAVGVLLDWTFGTALFTS